MLVMSVEFVVPDVGATYDEDQPAALTIRMTIRSRASYFLASRSGSIPRSGSTVCSD
jgi:hypothetical protein